MITSKCETPVDELDDKFVFDISWIQGQSNRRYIFDKTPLESEICTSVSFSVSLCFNNNAFSETRHCSWWIQTHHFFFCAICCFVSGSISSWSQEILSLCLRLHVDTRECDWIGFRTVCWLLKISMHVHTLDRSWKNVLKRNSVYPCRNLCDFSSVALKLRSSKNIIFKCPASSHPDVSTARINCDT